MSIAICRKCGGEISKRGSVCPKCGTKLSNPSGCFKVVLLALLVALVGLVALALLASIVGKRNHGTGPTPAATRVSPPPVVSAPDAAYPGPWRTDGPAFDKIAVTLGRNSIGGCGEFHYRLAKGKPDPGEALVYCTKDGRNWDHYLVFYKINNVMRVKAEPGVPLPKSLVSPD